LTTGWHKIRTRHNFNWCCLEMLQSLQMHLFSMQKIKKKWPLRRNFYERCFLYKYLLFDGKAQCICASLFHFLWFPTLFIPSLFADTKHRVDSFMCRCTGICTCLVVFVNNFNFYFLFTGLCFLTFPAVKVDGDF
jgi:hypothetical protein